MRSKNNSTFKIISYNLSFHKAAKDVKNLVKAHKPDVVCLQECRTNELPASFENLDVAGLTSLGEQGLAIYINAKRFALKSVQYPDLRMALIRRIIKEPRQRLIVAELTDRISKKTVVVANFHATHFIATNYHRRIETRLAIDSLKKYGKKASSVLIGDYNYPIRTKGLKALVENEGFSFAKPSSVTFKGYGIKDYFDFASYMNLISTKITSLPFGTSDHAPIEVVFEVK